MPAPIDKEAYKHEIIKAFQSCALEKPLPTVSLRDVAKKMGITHTALLYYFSSKDELLKSSSRWAGEQFCEMIRRWFNEHILSEYSGKYAYLDAFIEYSLTENSNKTMPRAVIMNCAMGDYSKELKETTREQIENIKGTLKVCLETSLAMNMTPPMVDGMCIILMGAYFCEFTSPMDDKQKESIVSSLATLLNVK